MEKKTLGTTIAALRKRNGMTQLDLANLMNVTDKAVSKWERDLSCPDVNSFPRLAEVLGVSTDDLLNAKTAHAGTESNGPRETALLALKCIGLAMGVAVVALGSMGEIGLAAPLSPNTGMTMLGIGLTCLGISAFNTKN